MKCTKNSPFTKSKKSRVPPQKKPTRPLSSSKRKLKMYTKCSLRGHSCPRRPASGITLSAWTGSNSGSCMSIMTKLIKKKSRKLIVQRWIQTEMTKIWQNSSTIIMLIKMKMKVLDLSLNPQRNNLLIIQLVHQSCTLEYSIPNLTWRKSKWAMRYPGSNMTS